MKYALLALAVCLVIPSGASAVEIVNPDGSRAEPYQTWADRARATMPDGRFTIYQNVDGCGDWAIFGSALGACTDSIATIWLHPRGCTPRSYRRFTSCSHRFYHELAHPFDRQFMDDAERAAFMSEFQLHGGWHEHDIWGSAPEEVFADTYSMCARGRRLTEITVPSRNGVGGSEPQVILSPQKYRRACALIKSFAPTKNAPDQ